MAFIGLVREKILFLGVCGDAYLRIVLLGTIVLVVDLDRVLVCFFFICDGVNVIRGTLFKVLLAVVGVREIWALLTGVCVRWAVTWFFTCVSVRSTLGRWVASERFVSTVCEVFSFSGVFMVLFLWCR